MKKLKIGIIGCGGIALTKHLPSLSKLKDKVELVGFCDIEESKAIKAKTDFGDESAEVYTDYLQLLTDTSIDVIHVLTPNSSHAEITIASLEAGKHVMCEKPMAINSAEAKLMVDAAKRTGKKLTIGYQNRFRQDSLALYEACRAGELGEIYYGKAHAIRRKAVPTWGVFLDKEKQGGGPLIDIGTHALDLALWLMDNYEPKLVVGSTYQKLNDKPEGNLFGPWNPDDFNVEDSAFAFIKMSNGATIQLEASWALNVAKGREAEVSLCGTNAGAEMLTKDDGPSKYLGFYSSKFGNLVDTHTAPASNVAYFGGDRISAGDLEAKLWTDAILEDKEPVVKPEEAYTVTRILEAVYESAKNGVSIEL